MANRSLSPNRVAQKLHDHRLAMIVLARMRAKKAIKEKLKADGVRVTLVPPRDITVLAMDYLAQHRTKLIAEAEHAIATWPGFKQWRINEENTHATQPAQRDLVRTT